MNEEDKNILNMLGLDVYNVEEYEYLDVEDVLPVLKQLLRD